MRLNLRDVPFTVHTAPGTPHPVRLKIAGLVFGLFVPEAIRLANELVDAAENLNQPTTGEQQ